MNMSDILEVLDERVFDLQVAMYHDDLAHCPSLDSEHILEAQLSDLCEAIRASIAKEAAAVRDEDHFDVDYFGVFDDDLDDFDQACHEAFVAKASRLVAQAQADQVRFTESVNAAQEALDALTKDHRWDEYDVHAENEAITWG